MDVVSYNTFVQSVSDSLIHKFDSELAQVQRPGRIRLRIGGITLPQEQRVFTLRSWLTQELTVVQQQIAVVSDWRRFASGDSDVYWSTEFQQLLDRLQWLNVKIERHALNSVLAQVRKNPHAAYQRLASLILSALVESVERIQKRLAKAAHLKALLYFCSHRSDRCRGFINFNREWFLLHGAHPTDSCLAAESCSTGGLTPAFA